MLMSSPHPLSIVAVGYSSGGLESVIKFFDETPCDHAIYVVLNHMAPDNVSYLQQILSRHTALQVVETFDYIPIEKNKIYINSPGRYLVITNGHLRSLPRSNFSYRINAAVNIFLESLAKIEYFKKIVVIFSGEGQDGAPGAALIKKVGGKVLVQDPDSCYASSMPTAVINATQVDNVLLPEQMPPLILKYAGSPSKT